MYPPVAGPTREIPGLFHVIRLIRTLTMCSCYVLMQTSRYTKAKHAGYRKHSG